MRHQRGQIFESHGAFHVRYRITEIVDGTPARVQRSHRLCTEDRNTGHGSPAAKAVRLLCEEFMREVNTQNSSVASGDLTVANFWQQTYLAFIIANRKHAVVICDQWVWRKHLADHFGRLTLREYKTPMFTVFLTSLAKASQRNTLRNVRRAASAIFAHAVSIGECDFNPIRDAKILGKTLPKKETEAYTLEEMQAILNALVDGVDVQLIMSLAFFCGLRRGEIQGLRWQDVHEDHVLVSVNIVGGVPDTLKGKKKVKVLPLIAPVRLLFRMWKAQAPSKIWVFSNREGNPVALKDVAKKRIQPVLKRAGLKWKGFHAGRRGLGTELHALTGNSNAGRDMLGHTDEQITQQHYEKEMPRKCCEVCASSKRRLQRKDNDSVSHTIADRNCRVAVLDNWKFGDRVGAVCPSVNALDERMTFIHST